MKTIRHNKIFALILLSLLLCLTPLYAKISFSLPGISADNRVLFNAISGGVSNQSVLFLTQLAPNETTPNASRFRQLTAFPEYMELTENGRSIQFTNAFGSVRIPVTGGLPRQIEGLPSFINGELAMGGRTGSIEVSGNGRWIVYLEAVSAAFGKLILLDTSTGNKTEVSSNIEMPDKKINVAWSPDSRFFIYGKGENIYYYGVSGNTIDERYRLIGEGSVNSVCWSGDGYFYYLRGSSLFRVNELNLFTRALYADFLELGIPAGSIPFAFNPKEDRFWIAPDSLSILVTHNSNNVFFFPLDAVDPGKPGGASFPYLGIYQSCIDMQVLWSADGIITVLVLVSEPIGTSLLAWRLTINETENYFQLITDERLIHYSGAALSPDGTKAVFWGQPGMILYDYVNWRPITVLSVDPAHSAIWNGNNNLICGGGLLIENIRLSAAGTVTGRNLLCLSQAEIYGFEEVYVPSLPGSMHYIHVKNGENYYATNGTSPWTREINISTGINSQVSSQYRVYLEEQSYGLYENIPMVRNISFVGTFPLIPGTGLRPSGRKEIALCFDLYDDPTGLREVLNSLDLFGLRATFFLGGEFIRRYPEAAREIALRGHETASLFYAPVNLSDTRFNVTSEFITAGLARNEDDFFRATGRELSLIWHPPYYASSPLINSAAASAGYLTAGRDFDTMDWITVEDEIRFGLPVYSSNELIERIMANAKDQNLIPIRLGKMPGNRREYLYYRLNVLLDALSKESWSIVPVSRILAR